MHFLRNRAGLPDQTSPVGMNLPGGTTVPGNNLDCVEMTDPSIMTHLEPIMTSFSILQDLRTQSGPILTYWPMTVAAGKPVGELLC